MSHRTTGATFATPVSLPFLFFKLQPLQIKLAPGKEDEVQVVVAGHRLQRKTKRRGLFAVWNIDHLIDRFARSIRWYKADVDRIHFDVRAAADRDGAKALF